MNAAINHIAFTTALLATHNGYITINNTKSGQHRTFKIAVVKKNSSAPDYLKGERVVSLLIGPDRENWTHWRRFGWVKDGKVRVWTSQAKKDGSLLKMAALLNNTDKGTKSGLEYLLEGTCSHCNKDLTHPVSVHLGMGPHCGGASWKALDKQLKAEAKAQAEAEETKDPGALHEAMAEMEAEWNAEGPENDALDLATDTAPTPEPSHEEAASSVATGIVDTFNAETEDTPKTTTSTGASNIAAGITATFLEELAVDEALCAHCAHCTTKEECQEGLLPWNGKWIPCSHLEQDAEAA